MYYILFNEFDVGFPDQFMVVGDFFQPAKIVRIPTSGIRPPTPVHGRRYRIIIKEKNQARFQIDSSEYYIEQI